ncbi:class II glutamine amidotransferase [Polyangium aurulentum]|uniref:class II glutamine amidotransferase n=1 Tax=Polyangium aurulentum TaxID=2567896 RepID=UPI0010ADB546|nr:class II glutamine amidotransferase [Polyangium aurulentum]UQA56559.1 class II glutamine amidotransferase [Polyangium aurulentum]
MPNLLAMSFEGELAPCFDLRCLHPGRKPPDGWGIGYYPGGEPSASVLKEPAPPHGSIRSELVKAWEHLEASLFVLHIRTATWGSISDANTQPFARSYGGRDWLFAHSGSLRHRVERAGKSAFDPVGSTDTELLFCELLGFFAASGLRSIGDCDPVTLATWFARMGAHGCMTAVLTDGRDLLAYADASGESALHIGRVVPPYERLALGDDEVEVDLGRRGVKARKGVLIASNPLEGEGATWTALAPGGLVVVRQGAVIAEVGPGAPRSEPVSTHFVSRPDLGRPQRAQARRLQVVHRTAYRYEKPVERSTHMLRLVPAHDRLQALHASSIQMSVDGKQRDYEDVFGNQVRRVAIDTPFSELVIEARSDVSLLDTEPFQFRPLHARSVIPLVWMPWQRQVLEPYLLPPELYESELQELAQYAMSFAERNDYDLVDTLLDLNQTIFREYEYRQGSTSLSTTPYEVYARRRGVCQDFANLFICLARLLGMPARYVCGYLYTGPAHPNQRQALASHAWVQVYLPEAGWKGFDPTNGVVTQTDHVRVAVGRSYIDATPTSGTIYVGGGRETLEVDVTVTAIDG